MNFCVVNFEFKIVLYLMYFMPTNGLILILFDQDLILKFWNAHIGYQYHEFKIDDTLKLQNSVASCGREIFFKEIYILKCSPSSNFFRNDKTWYFLLKIPHHPLTRVYIFKINNFSCENHFFSRKCITNFFFRVLFAESEKINRF